MAWPDRLLWHKTPADDSGLGRNSEPCVNETNHERRSDPILSGETDYAGQ